MKIVAVLAVRNEEHYLANALRHLARNGVSFAVLDNGSEDKTAEIANRGEFKRHLLGFQSIAFCGEYDWSTLLNAKMALIERIEADWVIHCDADEIMHSYLEGETLAEAIKRIDAGGFNAIDFNEFVFLPVDRNYEPDIDGEQPILSYYFFQPSTPRLMRAWKKSARLSMARSGGHILEGDVRLSPESMALRHYIFRDQQHAFDKYNSRRFASGDVARGWHGNRIGVEKARFCFPAREALHFLRSAKDRDLIRSAPRPSHYWQWPGVDQSLP